MDLLLDCILGLTIKKKKVKLITLQQCVSLIPFKSQLAGQQFNDRDQWEIFQ